MYQQAKLSKNTLKSDVCVLLRDCTVLQMVHLIFMLVWKILDPLLKVRVLLLHYFTLPICGENNHRDFFAATCRVTTQSSFLQNGLHITL